MPTHSNLAVRLLILVLLSITEASANTCPDGEFESCLFGACACLPQIKGDIGKAVEETEKELVAQTAGPALEQWLITSRNNAIGTAQPIPAKIRSALKGYIGEDTMNKARFKVGDDNLASLANLSIKFGDQFYGHEVAAVTMIDVIVFRNEKDAYNNPALWAHELTHVKQFHDWGTHEFAYRYVRDGVTVEKQAYAVGNGYDDWKDHHFESCPKNVLNCKSSK